MVPRNDVKNQAISLILCIRKMFPDLDRDTDVAENNVHRTQDHSQNVLVDISGNVREENASVPSTGELPMLSSDTERRSRQGSADNSNTREVTLGNLSDLVQADIDWDFNFPTMDLESFLSIDPNGSIDTGL